MSRFSSPQSGNFGVRPHPQVAVMNQSVEAAVVGGAGGPAGTIVDDSSPERPIEGGKSEAKPRASRRKANRPRTCVGMAENQERSPMKILSIGQAGHSWIASLLPGKKAGEDPKKALDDLLKKQIAAVKEAQKAK